MANRYRHSVFIAFLLIGTAFLGYALLYSGRHEPDPFTSQKLFRNQLNAAERKAARSEYFNRLLQDPSTGTIPDDIRERELRFARNLPRKARGKRKGGTVSSVETVPWQEIGPNNVGGRTRALAVDVDNSNTIIAGGVSGGIWKSTDGGASWTLRSTSAQQLSVSWIVQDTTSADNDTWYYSSGERRGNTAGEIGASFFGTGIFKSTDNGDTWSRLSSTEDLDGDWDSPFDFVSRIAVNPTNGDILAASNGVGIYRSQDGGSNLSLVLGSSGGHFYTDVTVNSNGDLLAILSEESAGVAPGPGEDQPGVYVSTDDGDSWTDRTPSAFPSTHDRSFAAFAPSNPDMAYILTFEGTGIRENEQVSFFKLDISDGSFSDRSGNLPDFGGASGYINTQQNYNMVVAVKPDDEDFVLIGTTNLFRSTDGFSTIPAGGWDDTDATLVDQYWAGGYTSSNDGFASYPNHHTDQHVLFFDPNDPGKVWSGHDGGLSYTSDITAEPVVWQDKNNGYNVTQYYHVSIPDENGDRWVMGGTQDNGTPIFTTEADGDSQGDASSGDGGPSYFGDNFMYNSTQLGSITRYEYGPGGIGGLFHSTVNAAFIDPPGATGQLFINPFAIDPNDETVIYYPGGDTLWRNTDIEDAPVNPGMGDFTLDDWENLTNLSPPGGTISAIVASRSNPAHRVYYAVDQGTMSQPLIYRIDNAHTAANVGSNLTDVSIGAVGSGEYIHNLALNPVDANEILAVISNYGATSLYHSGNGGGSWTDVEGNLDGVISMRDAAIIPLEGEMLYMLATSTGVYSTKTLNGSSTIWLQEGSGVLGNVVATSLAHRTSDNTVVVATHGRGIFGKIPKERLVEGNAGWRMMSAPKENMPISDITDEFPIQGFGDGFDKNFYTGYNGTSFTAPADLSGNLTSGEGFILYMFDNSQAGSSPLPHPISAEGSEPPGDVTVTLHAAGDRFNMVGNPYNAAIDFDRVTLDEVEDKWWVWDDATAQYYTYNGTTKVTTEPENDGRIAPWQGFIVQAVNGAGSPSITFSQDDKAHYAAQFYKDPDAQKVRTIRFTVNGHDLTDNNTVAVFYDGGSKEIDAGDMEELTPLANEYVSLSFAGKDRRDNPIRLANDARPFEPVSDQLFKMQIDASRGGRYTLQWNFGGIPEDWAVELYDRRSHQILNMKVSDRYSFEVSTTARKQSRASSSQSQPAIQETAGDPIETRFEMTVRPGEASHITRKPARFGLHQNYPNPFNPVTVIRYELAKATNVKLEVFNSIGRKVAVLVDARKPAGFYRAEFDGAGLASGIYYYRLRAGNFMETHPMTLIK